MDPAIEKELKRAAEKYDAYSADQLVAIFEPLVRQDGKVALVVTPEEAIQYIRDKPEYSGLFKTRIGSQQLKMTTATTWGELRCSGDRLQLICHEQSKAAGWWTDLETGEPLEITKMLVNEKLMLTVSELAEAMEGNRKDLMDDKLKHRKMVEVELADAVIRIADLAGALGLDLGGAIADKVAYNAKREDHKIENRMKDGGKKF